MKSTNNAAASGQYIGQNTGSGSGKMPSLNNNLSELDTLLQDLSNARYNTHFQERGEGKFCIRSTNILIS